MMRRGARRAAFALFCGVMTSVGGLSQALADPPNSAPSEQPAEDVNKTLIEKARVAIFHHEYRMAAKVIDELLARPGGEYNPVARGWLALRYGDLRSGASILLPLANKKEVFKQHISLEFRPLIMGSLAFHMGDRDHARELLRSAIEQIQLRLGLYEHTYSLILESLDLLGQLHRERGEHRAARQCIQEMRDLQKYRGFPPAEAVLPDLHQAELYLAKGDVAQAAQALKQIERYLDKPTDLPKYMRARILTSLGVIATRRGEVREAEKLHKEALALREAVYHPFNPAVIESLRHLANLYIVMGKIQDAVTFGSRAAELADKRARHILSMGSERQKRIAARHIENDTDAIVSLHLQHAPLDKPAARAALTSILRRKGMVFEAMLGGFTALRENLDADGQALFRELAELSAQMSTMISRGPVDVTLEDFQNDLFDLQERRRALEDRLADNAGRGSKIRFDDQPLAALNDIQRNIPDGAALVELFEYRPHRPFGPPVHSTWGKPRFAAYILQKTGDPKWADLGPANAINNTATKLVHELSTSGNYRPLARELDELVMRPLRQALGTTRWLLLSPDGGLNFVPFYALVDENDREVVETMSITYLMTGRDLLRFGSAPRASRQEALIVANPDFGQTVETEMGQVAVAESRALDLSRVSFSQLKGTQEEGQQVQKTMGKAQLLAGTNATEEAIKEVQGPRVLHIATHGFFLPDIVNVTGDSSKTGPDPWNANPLLRSGLALHGANRRKSQTEREDGVLTALEVSNLDLQGTRLVVLSACETGVGQALRGEGVYGLQRAMMIAGAETQVTSLWQVDDAATKNLMVRFYEELARGAGRGEAMRTAQLAVRQSYGHPYYWASFVVTGSSATLDGKTMAPSMKGMQVAPGAGGCACTSVHTDASWSGWIAGAVAAMAMARRRRRERV